jgi:hypothetical protein
VSAPDESLQQRVRALEDRAAIIEVVGKFAFCIDRRRWTEFETCFAARIRANTIRTGGWVEFERPTIIEVLSRAFESYTATQHISANHQVAIDADTAVVWSTLNATHYRKGMPGGEFQQQVGYYEYGLVREDSWRINSIQQYPHWQTGNQQIFDSTVD